MSAKSLSLIFLLFAAGSNPSGGEGASTAVLAHRLSGPARQSSLLERMAEQEDGESTGALLDITKESVK